MAKDKITCTFKDLRELYVAYMPFLKKGGLFVKTNEDFSLGNVIELEIFFFEEKQPKIIDGKVVWLTFPDIQRSSHAGVGIQFEGETSKDINDLIQKYLSSFTDLESVTDTM